MTRLYVAPGAGTFGAHVVVRELGLPVDVVKVPSRVEESAGNAAVPLENIPALEADDGALITEDTAILPYLADLQPGTALFAPPDSVERAQIQSWIGYLNSELHASFWRAANRYGRHGGEDSAFAAIRCKARRQLKVALAYIDAQLAGKSFLIGNRFTIADAYLGVFARWLARLGSEFAGYENINRFREAYNVRPSVAAALAFENDV